MREFKFDNVSIIYRDKDVGIGKKKLIQTILVTFLFFLLYFLIMYLTFKVHFSMMFLLLIPTWFHKEIIKKILEQYEYTTPYSKLVYDILHMENLQSIIEKGKVKLIVNNKESFELNDFFKDFDNMRVIREFPLKKDYCVVIDCIGEQLKVHIKNKTEN